MTTRAAALAGLRFFADVRAIAAQVGVVVPADEVLAARFAATDSIDLAALSDDAAMLGDVLGRLHGTIDTAHDARRGLPAVWRGEAADAADTAVGAHLRSARDVVDGIGTVSSTIAAAATALGRVQDEKHRTLAALRTDRVGGQKMSTITADDVAADPEPYRTDIAAAVHLFGRTMDVVDDAVGVILTALTDSFGAVPAPREVGPGRRPVSADGSTARRDPRSRRPDLVVSPTTGPDRTRAGDDPTVLVAAISAGATVASAALAAASSVGTAVIDGVAGLLTHTVDSDDRAQDTDGAQGGAVPEDRGDAQDRDGAQGGGGFEKSAASVRDPGSDTSTASDPPASSDPGREADATARRNAPELSPAAAAEPPATSPPQVPSSPSRPLGADSTSATPPVAPTPSTADRTPAADDVEARGVPSAGPRLRDREPSRGRPDPDDGGGLALAGDR